MEFRSHPRALAFVLVVSLFCQILTRSPPTNIFPATLTVFEDTLPVSMVSGTSCLVTYVLPFPLSLWGVSSTLPYTFKIRNAAYIILSSSPNIVLTDANPSYSMNYTFPIAITDFIRINAAGGDGTYYSSSYVSVWKRTVTNLFALTTFDSWFLNAASVGIWQSNYPNSLTLTAGTTLDWFVAAQTGSTDLFPPYVQSLSGFTLAARWSTATAECNATSDIVDTYVSALVSASASQTTSTQPSSSVRHSWIVFGGLVVVCVCVF